MRKTTNGFTIVELLVVIVVIAILAVITVVAYNNIQSRATDSSQKSAVAQFRKLMELYKIDNGQYPQLCSQDNIGCGITTPTATMESLLTPTYTASLSRFPVGTDYVRGGTNGDAYGMLISYKSGQCKTGSNVYSGWWGSSVPICP